MNQNASRADIVALLRTGLSNSAVARQLHCDKGRVRRIREECGLPAFVPAEQTRTAEDKWRELARPVDDGHMEWTGEHVGPTRSPVMRHKETSYSPTAIAFQMRHGRPPTGYAIADCGRDQCVAPDHVDDEAGRLAKREETRRASGRGDRPDVCRHGHDQRVDGRLQSDGTPYCEACKRALKTEPEKQREARIAAKEAARQARAAAQQARREAREAVRQSIEALLRQGVPQLSITRTLHVAPITVQRTRKALGLPAPQRGRRVVYRSLAEALHANTTPADGGHVLWTGRGSGNPQVSLRRKRFAAARVSFELHHGRPPVGPVLSDCDTARCLAGAHLADRPMRETNRRADKAFSAIFGRSA